MRLVAIMGATLLAACAAHAQAQARVRASVDRTTVSVGSPFYIQLEVSGGNIGAPEIPDADGIAIRKQAAQQATGTQIMMNGATTTVIKTVQLGFEARATRAGRLTVPPIKVTVDGQVFSTQPLVVNAVDGPVSGASGAQPRAGGKDQVTWDDAIFLDSDVDKREVYQGEPVKLTLSLGRLIMRGLQVGNFPGQQVQFPKAEGFYAVPVDPASIQVDRNGRRYEVTQFHQILYPTTSGDLRIEGWHWEGVGNMFFDSHQFSSDTPAIDIKVKPIPERPPNFCGAVGSVFFVRAQLARTDLFQGVPVKFEVRVSGQGSPDAIAAPPMPKIENAYVSDPETTSRPVEDVNGGVVEKCFAYTVTPLAAGELDIPPIEFCYFDPSTAKFEVKKTDAFAARVAASKETAAPPPMVIAEAAPQEPGRVDVLGEDILPIVAEAGPLRPHRTSRAIPAGLVLFPPAAYGAFAVALVRRRRLQRDTGYARDYYAKSKGRKRLGHVADAAEPSEELFHALSGYIADKLNVAESGLTSSDARQLFESRGIDPPLIENFTKILRACERARYAGARLSADEVGALTQGAAVAMEALEAELKRARGRRT